MAYEQRRGLMNFSLRPAQEPKLCLKFIDEELWASAKERKIGQALGSVLETFQAFGSIFVVSLNMS